MYSLYSSSKTFKISNRITFVYIVSKNGLIRPSMSFADEVSEANAFEGVASMDRNGKFYFIDTVSQSSPGRLNFDVACRFFPRR